MSVLIPVRNEERHIPETIRGLQAQDHGGALEFLFIDGRSIDRTRAILEESAKSDNRIKVLDNPDRHTPAALNVGLLSAIGEYVARVDAHAEYPPQYLSRAVERLERGDVQWVSGPQLPHGFNAWSQRIALALRSSLATGGSMRWESDVERKGDGEVELGTGVFTGVCRRELLQRHGGWDNRWPINQDSELAARVRRAGGRIVSRADMAARYSPRQSLQALSRQYWRYGMYRAKTFLRHPETLRPSHLAMPVLVTGGLTALGGRSPASRPARWSLAAYAVAVMSESARITRGEAYGPGGVAIVLFAMHFCWGGGYLVGLIRFGPILRETLSDRKRGRARWSPVEAAG